ncbi:alpha/beta hydrolase [Duganella sp. P38]|uniref:alpha/beta hydrolase n=1 Tax=Duganella sp. P38 TaxID=3423949 RepID=UPI003D79CC14
MFAAAIMCVGRSAIASPQAAPLVIGESWSIDSSALGEKRRINVYRPAGLPADMALPVMYMPDGGVAEDFLHVAGLLQVGAANMTTRPFMLVGIENTERRRDLTGPTDVAKDRSIAPRVGGSKAYRAFIRDELMPEVAKRYRVTTERAIVGESLAGLFVVETLVQEPELFDTYIALDPSLWWNGGKLLTQAAASKRAFAGKKSLYIASSADGQSFIDRAALAATFGKAENLSYHYEDWPAETHASIYHPAALKAFRLLLATRPE